MSKKLLLVGLAIALLLGFTSQARAGTLVNASFTLVDDGVENEEYRPLVPQPPWEEMSDSNYDNMFFGLSGYWVNEQPPRNPAGELVEMGPGFPNGGEQSTIWYTIGRSYTIPSADASDQVAVGVVDANGNIEPNLVVFTTAEGYQHEGAVTRLVLTTWFQGDPQPDPPIPPYAPVPECDIGAIQDFFNVHVHDKGSGQRTTGAPTVPME